MDANPKTISEGNYLRLARLGRWEYVERVQASGVVAILAATGENKLILIEQFRPAVGKTVVEIPAGLAGDQDAGECLQDAAVRELFEETGYKAERWERLFEGPSSAGLTSESVTFYLAQGLIRHGADSGDGTEEITVHEIPAQEVEPWLAGRIAVGHVIDCRVYTALFLARKALGL